MHHDVEEMYRGKTDAVRDKHRDREISLSRFVHVYLSSNFSSEGVLLSGTKYNNTPTIRVDLNSKRQLNLIAMLT